MSLSSELYLSLKESRDYVFLYIDRVCNHKYIVTKEWSLASLRINYLSHMTYFRGWPYCVLVWTCNLLGEFSILDILGIIKCFLTFVIPRAIG